MLRSLFFAANGRKEHFLMAALWRRLSKIISFLHYSAFREVALFIVLISVKSEGLEPLVGWLRIWSKR